MFNPSRQFPHMQALAEYIEAEAGSIRSRVSRASASSQHVMRAKAAAYEECAKAIRANIGNNAPTELREQLTASLEMAEA